MSNRRYGLLLSVFCLALMLPAGVSAAAQPVISETLARRVEDAVVRAETDPRAAIGQLEALLQRQRAPMARAFVAQQKAAIHIRLDEVALARDDLVEVLRNQPADFAGPLRLLLGQTYLMLDDFDSALMELEAWHDAQRAPDPNGLFLLGYAYLRSEQLPLAIARLEQAVETVQEVPRNHWIELLAYAYARADRPGDAQQLIERLIERDPSQARWWRQLAAMFLLMEETRPGAASLTVAEQLQPESRAATVRLARFLAHVGTPADGAALLEAALASKDPPVTLEHQLLLAEMWLLAREFDAAIAAFERAERIDPSDGKAPWIMGQMYLHWERYAAAAEALNRAAQRFGEQAPAQLHYLRAVTLINLQRYDAARAALRLLSEFPTYAERADALQRYLDAAAAAS